MSVLDRAGRAIRSDLREDPYLPYVLLVATVLSSFWFWHRIPNFATRDEQVRLLDVMVAFGTVLSDPGIEALTEGVSWGRAPFGATFYLYAVGVFPVVLLAIVRGQLDVFLGFKRPDPTFGYWVLWHGTPVWVWATSIATVRLFSVAFAVGSVYLTYRLGVALRDRTTGRLAAALLSVTFGLLTLAHEGGEDLPALFFLLLSLYLLVHYVRTGEAIAFLAASAFGGVAIAFKLTAAPIVAVVGAAFLLRVDRAGPAWRGALLRPGLLIGGASLGLLTAYLGFPTAIVAGIEPIYVRVFEGSASRASWPTGPDAPTWWWFLRQYLNAFGLPLFIGTLGGLAATVLPAPDRSRDWHATVLVLFALAGFVAMFAQWHDFRTHHLLPTFPLLVLLLAAALVRLRDRSPRLSRVLVAVLLVSAAVYATAGVAGYATAPRDDAVAWFDEHAERNATVEVYRVHVQDTAVPHWMDVSVAAAGDSDLRDPCPDYIQLGYRDLTYLMGDHYYRSGDAQARYVRALLDGQYNYEVVAEFGPRPPNYVPQQPRPGSLLDLVRTGVVPETDQYADEQELRPNQFTMILARTGPCDGSRSPPEQWW